MARDNGPDLPFAGRFIAAERLHRTGRSCIAQHCHRLDDRRADFAAFRFCHLNVCTFPIHYDGTPP